MSKYCPQSAQNCSMGCCTKYGSCPPNASVCYYYYSAETSKPTAPTLSGGAIAGIVIGSITLIIIMAFAVYCACRACIRKRNLSNIQAR